MSTQFFHPHLIPHLVVHAGLLDMLIDKSYQVLQNAFKVCACPPPHHQGPNQPASSVDASTFAS
jgi:hypothetical protein